MTDELDDLFHWCAFAAYIEQARACQDWPESQPVQRRAYELYEQHLREAESSITPAHRGRRVAHRPLRSLAGTAARGLMDERNGGSQSAD